MIRKTSRNEKHKYSNEEKLALGGDENTISRKHKHTTISFGYFFQSPLLFHTPCLLETLEY